MNSGILLFLALSGTLALKLSGDDVDPFFDTPKDSLVPTTARKAVPAPLGDTRLAQLEPAVTFPTTDLTQLHAVVAVAAKAEPYQPHPLERGFYADETKAAWSYNENSADGPENWYSVDKSFQKCAEASAQQSPLDLFTFRVASPMSPLLTPAYAVGDLAIRNTGNYIRLVPHKGSVLYWGDKAFDLIYAGVHTPSEHHMGGETFPAEVQFVHKAQDDDQLAVLALLYKPGLDNAFVERILEVAPSTAGGEAMLGGAINLGDVIPKDITQYKSGTRISYPHYTYDGSLTTPPCRENVRWFVWSKPDHIGRAQIERLRRLVRSASARPIQNVNGRVVEYKTLF